MSESTNQPKPVMITVTLTKSQWAEISEAAGSYKDCGPEGEGWQSDHLKSAVNALDSAIAEFEKTRES